MSLVPHTVKQSDHVDQKDSENYCPTSAILDGGVTYRIYRVFLHNDGFNQRSILFPNGSVGGFYLQPVFFSKTRRRQLSSIRPISLTPKSLSTNLVFYYIMQDILQCSSSEKIARGYTGSNVLVFNEEIGFVANYSASSYTLDPLNHNASCLCTHCFFMCRSKGRQAQALSRYSYSTSIH